MVDSTLFSLATLNAHPAMNPDSVIQGDIGASASSQGRARPFRMVRQRPFRG